MKRTDGLSRLGGMNLRERFYTTVTERPGWIVSRSGFAVEVELGPSVRPGFHFPLQRVLVPPTMLVMPS